MVFDLETHIDYYKFLKQKERYLPITHSVLHNQKLWNSLPDYLRLSTTIDKFKKDLKMHLLDKLLILQLPNYIFKSIQLVTFTIVITLNYVFI